MLRGLVLATLFVLTIGGKETASANDALPSVVLKGLQEMQDGGCRDAFDLWTSQWQSGDDVVRRQQLVSSCDILSQAGGAFRGYDVVKDVGVTPHLRRLYVLLRYERQPIYLLVVAYAAVDEQWKVATINWNTDPDKVLPPSLFDPQQPAP